MTCHENPDPGNDYFHGHKINVTNMANNKGILIASIDKYIDS